MEIEVYLVIKSYHSQAGDEPCDQNMRVFTDKDAALAYARLQKQAVELNHEYRKSQDQHYYRRFETTFWVEPLILT